ncbi:MAG: SdpA family antimicrobial peptide system protein [Cyclobacteriaceae bacterium]|nr:SdpA family antimicrobial peptide system protein [Cyclobacteriaceae bacterium]UYN87151.1 MAG: SdpA family antimicrobial peptide system protein [Cyclobacteriaceae bacterium]
MPYNSLRSQFYNKDHLFVRRIFPEGFSFFTRDPREPQVILYTKNAITEVIERSNSINYYFGFSRYGRALSIELSSIWETVRNQKWYDCYTCTQNCFNDEILPHYSIQNSTPSPFICGEYYLKITEPIPWAWAKSFKSSNRSMPCKMISISIKCN